MPRINLLPWREQQRTDRKKAFGVGLGVAFLGALVVTGLGYLFFGQLVDAQQERNRKLTAEIKVLDKQIEQINSLEIQKQQFIARMEIIEKLQRSRPEIVHIFDTFVKTIPDGTYLTAITQTDKAFKIQGVVQSPTRVSTLMRSLDASGWFTDPYPDEIKKATTFGSEFTVTANQKVVAQENDAKAKVNATRKKP